MDSLQTIRDGLLAHFNPKDAFPVKTFGFDHRKFSNENYQWAHYEDYRTDKVEIVHLVVMPWQNSNAPIFGFDIINISNTLTGMFLDLTPVDNQSFTVPKVGVDRPVPEWGGFFSDNFLCCKPNSIEDVMTAVDLLSDYLKMLPSITEDDYSSQQQSYINGQRLNPQTLKMLTAHLGDDMANEYFYNYLWPNVK